MLRINSYTQYIFVKIKVLYTDQLYYAMFFILYVQFILLAFAEGTPLILIELGVNVYFMHFSTITGIIASLKKVVNLK